MGKSKVKGSTGKRYTDAQKKEILDFINKHGRGGVTAAQRKYGVSYVAVTRWRNGLGLGGKVNAKATKAGTAYSSLKNADIQREIKRQLDPHLKQMLRVKAGIKALIQAL